MHSIPPLSGVRRWDPYNKMFWQISMHGLKLILGLEPLLAVPLWCHRRLS